MHAERTLTRYYLYSLLAGLQFGTTTWLVFLVARGANPGLAQSAYHLAILLGEVPTGIVADLVGRRLSMLIGLLFGAITSLGYLLIHDSWTAVLVIGLSGLGTTFLSGADSALLYETAHAIGGAEMARKSLARASAIRTLALGISPLIAGALYTWQDTSPFWVRAILTLASMAVVWGMVEQKAERPHERRPDVWHHTRTALRVVTASPNLMVILGFLWVYNATFAMGAQFGQAYFPATGLTMIGTGLIFTLSRFTGSVTNWINSRLSERSAAGLMRFGPLFQSSTYLGMGLTGGWIGAGAFLASDLLDGLLYPTAAARLNEAIPSEQRATILSFQSAGQSLLISAIFPVVALLQPVTSIYLVLGAIGLTASIGWMIWRPVPRPA